VLLARKAAAIRPPANSEPRAGCSELPITATACGHATTGKFIRQSVSLVVAARPLAGRSPVAAPDAKYRSSSRCQTRMGSGTLRFVKHKLTWQSNTKVSRPSHVRPRLGLGFESNGANPDA